MWRRALPCTMWGLSEQMSWSLNSSRMMPAGCSTCLIDSYWNNYQFYKLILGNLIWRLVQCAWIWFKWVDVVPFRCLSSFVDWVIFLWFVGSFVFHCFCGLIWCDICSVVCTGCFILKAWLPACCHGARGGLSGPPRSALARCSRVPSNRRGLIFWDQLKSLSIV